MRSPARHIVPAAGALALLVLAFGLTRLFQARFAVGDGYPPYSTFRTDPQGARALFAVYSELSDEPVSRNTTPLAIIADGEIAGATFVRLGMGSFTLPEPQAEKLEAFAEAGARVVIALDTINYLPKNFTVSVDQEDDDGGEEIVDTGTADLLERWGFDIRYTEAENDTDRLEDIRPEQGWPVTGSGEPPARWWTPARLDQIDGDWITFASVAGEPVGIERPWGAGSIVVLTGSYFASNESLSQDPPTPFLQHVFGSTGSRPVIFDETQLGTVVEPGIIGLIYRYRLGGALLGFACVLGLYIWKNSSPLVTPDSAAEARRYADASIRGSDAATGFVRLIRRHVPSKSLLSTAFQTWNSSAARRKLQATSSEATRRAEALIADQESLPPRERDLTGTYNQLVSILNPSRK